MMKKSLMTLAVIFFCAGIGFAGDHLKDRNQDRKNDGSCLEDAIESAPGLKLAADRQRDRDQDRKKDGSCLEDAVESAPGLKLAADRQRDRDRDQDKKHDGSCQL